MRKTVTILLFCIATALTGVPTYAQSQSGVPLLVPAQQNRAAVTAHRVRKPSLRAQSLTQGISYADTDAYGSNHFIIPTTLDSEGTPYLAYLAFAERFTLPTAGKWYLDSADVTFATFNYDSVDATDRIALRALHGDYFVKQAGSPFDGMPFPFSSKTMIDSAQVAPNLIPAAEDGATSVPVVGYTLKFKHKRLPEPMFYLELTVGDTAMNQVAMWSDGQTDDTHPGIDTSRDRAYWLGTKSWDKANTYSNFLGGAWFQLNPSDNTDTLWLYPNFLMTAYVSDPSQGGVTKAISSNGFELTQNYPNPFNPSTEISYTVPSRLQVTLTVSNALGQTVATLFDGIQTAGEHSVTFDASTYPSGTYFYTLKSGAYSQTMRMVLSK